MAFGIIQKLEWLLQQIVQFILPTFGMKCLREFSSKYLRVTRQ